MTTATVGHDPLYLTRGGTLLPTAEIAKKGSGQSQAVNNLRTVLGGLNPALGAALHTDKQSRKTPYEAPLWRTVQQLKRVTGPLLSVFWVPAPLLARDTEQLLKLQASGICESSM